MTKHYQKGRDFDIDWIRRACDWLLSEFENHTLKSDHLERFYDNMWKLIIDTCLYELNGVEPVRGESGSTASAGKKMRIDYRQEQKACIEKKMRMELWFRKKET
ncbi:hypothetical protein VTP01DRAFT_10691 [Rhizomucor pusillus]|uniref:uncharacterized protein n=1 Tax=Rhizomucor pusillus TaxID=4840 RepID=UPI0037440137